MSKVTQFLTLHRQTAEQVNRDEQMRLFAQKMQQGLAAYGQPIKMIPTYLCNVSPSQKHGGKYIVIDAGGTNFRSAVGYFDKEGVARFEDLQKTFMPASNGVTLSKRQFYDQIAANVSRLANEATDIGFCFSYPVAMHPDLDGEITNFTKEMAAPEAVGTSVGKELVNALQAYGKKQRKIVILNDTVATLLGGLATAKESFSTFIGYIYGTGTNICCIVDTNQITKVSLPQGKMIINMECGGYDGFELGDFEKAALATTAPTQLFEKATSGKYLANVIYQGFCFAQKEGLFQGKVNLRPFELKEVSAFLTDGGFEDIFTCPEDKIFATELCTQAVRRAAKMGAIANAATATFTCTNKALPVAIVAEGTTFGKLPGYRQYFQEYLHLLLDGQGISFKILQGDDLNLVGTLMATMCL